MDDDKIKVARGEAWLREAALDLSYQYIIDWAQGRIDEQTPPDAQAVSFDKETQG